MSSGKRFVGYARGGVAPHAAAIRALLEAHEGKQVVVTVARFVKRRSVRQNRFYFGFVLKPIWEALRDLGNDYTPEEAHLILKGTVGGLKKPVFDRDGEVIDWVVTSSTKLTTMEWEEWMERIRAWAMLHLGLKIPYPNEMSDEEIFTANDNFDEWEDEAMLA